MPNVQNPLVGYQNNLTGRCIKSVDSAKIEFVANDKNSTTSDHFADLINMKYTDNGIAGVTKGMTKINATALTSHPLIRNSHHLLKVQPAESHYLVQAFNSGETESVICQNTTAIPTAGDFSATVLHTDASNAGQGFFSDAPDEHVAYCNSAETMVWGGDATRVANFTIYDPNGTFVYDYTSEVQNTLATTDNVATLKQIGGIGAETTVLFHYDDTAPFQSDDPGSTHSGVANGGMDRSAAQSKFGGFAALFDGVDDFVTITDHADFDNTSGLWTYETWYYPSSLAADAGLYAQGEEGFTQDYIWIYVDTNGAVHLKIREGTTAATGTVTLTGGGSGSVDSVTVNGVTVTSGAVAFNGTLGQTAIDVAANITAHTSAPNYTASAASSVITITPDRKGADVNTFAVVSNTTTITSTDVNLASGASTEVVSLSTPAAVVTTSSWHHIRVVENGNNYYIFVGGVQKAHTNDTSRTEGAQAYDSDVHIGVVYDGTSTSKLLSGYIDETRITNNVLSTSNFEVPASAYTSATASVNMRVGNTMPIDGITFTVSNANTSTGTLSVFYWGSGAWQAVTTLVDNTVVGGIPLSVSGSVTFDSTANIAQPSIIDGIFGFWFKVEITDADTATALSHVTVSEPWQAIQDFWDGEYRASESVQLFEENINKDNTINVLDDSFVFDTSTGGNTATYMVMDSLITPEAITGSLTLLSGSSGTVSSFLVDGIETMSGAETYGNDLEELAEDVAANITAHVSIPNYTATSFGGNVIIIADKETGVAGLVVSVGLTGALAGTSTNMTLGANPEYLQTGFAERQQGFRVKMIPDRVNSTANTVMTVSYWSGASWVSVGDLTDGTIDNNISFAKSGFVTWNPIAANTEFKMEINKETSLYYYKIEWNQTFSDDVLCYFFAGIPVQRRISTYKFPIMAKGRLWLFSDQAEKKNQAIVSNLGELNTFNGIGAGDPMEFGDKTEIVAAVEVFERTSASVESHVLVAKNNSIHVVEGLDPETWNIINVTDNIGCNASKTLKASTIGLEYSPLQRKQVAIWQGSSGIYMFDNQAVHPISDDIGNFFDQRNSDAINLAAAHLSYGFFSISDGEHFYHWCFASGSSTTLNKEWVLDLKRQKWFEIDRGTGKQLQGASITIDTTGNFYTYGFEDNGFVQRLNNGTTYDGNNIQYVFETGDLIPGGDINTLSSVDSIKLATISKETTTSNILVYHYGDTKDAATVDSIAGTSYYSLTTANTGSRVAFPFKRVNTPQHITHKFRVTMTTNDETVGFEPLYFAGFYKGRGLSELNITD